MNLQVESAIVLPETQKQALLQKLEALFPSPLEVEFQVDPKIIGGLRIICPEKTYDLSLKARLNQVSESIFS